MALNHHPSWPPIMVLTDRDDGKLWRLSLVNAEERFAINDVPASRKQTGHTITYGPYAGPVLGTNPRLRLLIRGGRFGYEVAELGQGETDKDNARVFAYNGGGSLLFEVLPLQWQRPNDPLWWRSAL